MMNQQRKSTPIHIALWVVQALLALIFVGTGLFKLATPLATLAAMWPWAGDYPALLRLTGVADLCGGIGLVLPALIRIRPGVTVLAALGCAVLLACAIVFHLARGEAGNAPFNLILLGLTLVVFWGRRIKSPIHSRR